MKYKNAQDKMSAVPFWLMAGLVLGANSCAVEDVVFKESPPAPLIQGEEEETVIDEGKDPLDSGIQVNVNDSSSMEEELEKTLERYREIWKRFEGPCTEPEEIFPDGICAQDGESRNRVDITIVDSEDKCTAPTEFFTKEETDQFYNIYSDEVLYELMMECPNSCIESQSIVNWVWQMMTDSILRPLQWATEYYEEDDHLKACEVTCGYKRWLFRNYLDFCRNVLATRSF